MKAKTITLILVMVVLGAFAPESPTSVLAREGQVDVRPAALTAPVGTAFTYQGQLSDSGTPADGVYDFQFTLWDAGSFGDQVGPADSEDDIVVEAGILTVLLDFGTASFDGSARYLEIGVRPGGETGSYTTLSPRQEITATPYALFATAAPWSGLSGMPAGFADNIDDNTTYSAGSGLDLISNQFSVQTDAIQARVSGACAVGSSIRAVNADGTVVCQTNTPAYRSTFRTFTTLDSGGNVGQYPSTTIGADGLGLVVYVEDNLGHLKVAHCSNMACTSATITTLVSVGVGYYPSITVGVDGLGLISYYDNTDLGVAHCDDIACTTATFGTLDSAGQVGERSSITIGADGLGLVSYYDDTNDTLKVAHCSDTICTSATISTLDSVGTDSFYGESSITIGADGFGLISYLDLADGDLNVAHCSNIACTSASISTVDSSGGGSNSIAIGADGLGLISYSGSTGGDEDLMVAHCSDISCSAAMLSHVDTGAWAGRLSSITIGPDGLGLVSYQGPAGALWAAAHCNDIPCTNATSSTLLGSVGGDSGITIGVDGLPLVVHYDSNNGDLQVVHCSNASCSPTIRRR